MEGETSPFIETQNDKVGGTIRISDSVDMSYVINVLIVIAVIYMLYLSYNKFGGCDDSDDEDTMSFIEEQVEMLNTKQLRNLR
jgi:hypothetical protein